MGLLTVQEVEFAVQVAKLRHKERVLQFIEVNFIEPTKVRDTHSLTHSLTHSTIPLALIHHLHTHAQQQYADHFAVYKSALPRQVQVISMDISKNQTLLDNVIFYGDNSLNDMQENIKNKDATQVLTHSPNHLPTHSPNHLLTHSPNHLLTHPGASRCSSRNIS
jgi:hypothetical protein